MNKRIEITRILNNLLLMFSLSMVISSGLGAPLNGSLVLACLVLSAFVLVSELIQDFVGNLILFILCHLMGIAAVVAAVSSIYTASKAISRVEIGGVYIWKVLTFLFVIFMLIATILGIYTRVDGKGRFYPDIAEALFFIGLFLFCKVTRTRSAEAVVLLMELAWGILVVIYYNARQVIGALITYHDGDFVPHDQIRKNNGTMLRISLAVAAVGMLLCTALDYGKELLDALKAAIIRFLRWLFSHFHFEPVEETEIEKTEPMGGGFGQFLPEPAEDNSIWHEILNALFWVIALIVAVFIVYAVIKLIKQFYKYFNGSRIGIRDRLNRDKKEFLSPLENENENTFGRTKKDSISLLERLSKRGRIRLMFVKYVERGRNFAEIKSSNTPSEIEKISLERDAAAYKLYEKARYSTKDITDADVVEMKSISR